MKKSSITKNYIYNVLYQIMAIILPIITTPYISRALGAEAIGTYSYIISIGTYFVLVGTLGLTNYGKREIAYVQEDKEKRDKIFSELFILRVITTLITVSIYIVFFCINNEEKLYYQILSLEIIAMVFDIGWFFQGIEDFKKVVIRNTIVKLISIILIFILVKKPSDLWIYFSIYSLSVLLGNMTLWFKINKYIKIRKVKLSDLAKHIKPTISLFIPQIASSIYTVLDKTMLGNMAENISEVGYYEQSQKIIQTALTIVTTIGVVMVPRIANTYASGNKEKISNYMKKTFNFIWFLSIPIVLGIIGVANDLVPWFFGDEYSKVTNLLILSAPVVLLISTSTIIGSQFLMSVKKQNVHTMAVITGAVINVLLNCLLLKDYGSIGAVISSIVAEFTIVLIEVVYVTRNKFMSLQDIFYKAYKYFITGIVMFIIIWILQSYLNPGIISTIIEVGVGGIVYIGILLITKDEFLYNYMIKKILKRKEVK